MSDENELDEREEKLAEALRSLVPVESSVYPIAAAFTAGRLSGRRSENTWRAAAILCALAICVHILPDHKSAHMAVTSPAATADQPMPSGGENVMQLDQDVLDHGLAGLPVSHFATMPVMSARHRL